MVLWHTVTKVTLPRRTRGSGCVGCGVNQHKKHGQHTTHKPYQDQFFFWNSIISTVEQNMPAEPAASDAMRARCSSQ